MNVHASANYKLSFKCDYGPCQRAKEPFTRKDHYRDHLRDYHKEDLGCAKGDKNAKDKKRLGDWQKLQSKWLGERQIRPLWWRCARCLIRVNVRDHGWECVNCKQVCEPERREAREMLVKNTPVVETTASYSSCTTCSGTAWVENMMGGWAACPNCQPSAGGEYDVADMEQYPSSSSLYY